MKKIFADGTFSITPPLFKQVYCLLAEKRGFVFPILYALLPDKSEETYSHLLRALVNRFPAFQPDTVSVDFELAAVNAFKSIFRSIQVNGCLYHLCHNIKKHVSEAGLTRNYVQDPEFAIKCRSIVALSFLKPEDVEEGIDTLEAILPPELVPVLNYFEDTYVGRLNPRTLNRRPPTFPISMWSVHDRVMNSEDRTNNYAEAAHRRLQSEVQVDHPTIWLFIDALRRAQKGRDLTYEAMLRGEEPPKKRKRYMLADERILRVVEHYLTDGNVADLLRAKHKVLSFDGKPKEWRQFKSVFRQLIEQKQCTQLEKLEYLRLCCRGEAFRTISVFVVDGKNYEPALQRLEEHYGWRQQLLAEVNVEKKPKLKLEKTPTEPKKTIVREETKMKICSTAKPMTICSDEEVGLEKNSSFKSGVMISLKVEAEDSGLKEPNIEEMKKEEAEARETDDLKPADDLKKRNVVERMKEEAEAREVDELKPVDDVEMEKTEKKLEAKPLMLEPLLSEKAASVNQTYEKPEHLKLMMTAEPRNWSPAQNAESKFKQNIDNMDLKKKMFSDGTTFWIPSNEPAWPEEDNDAKFYVFAATLAYTALVFWLQPATVPEDVRPRLHRHVPLLLLMYFGVSLPIAFLMTIVM
ncbi:hypothetical protein QR680_011672 [Steinernema hermaphroditum]|uniref:MULE transposase domain-containing protein n=1 Tax=Steinernema hermaphroditum TaxID=289476 RepID=A0AA39I1Z4_9BILA|nr:hypothetical protein QR680_011672 [Steinernema hermaphroditum]